MSLLGRIRKKRSARNDPSQEFYSLNDLDRKIMRYLTKDEGFFVELGANDGINQSNTLHLEKFHGWRGVLIEPIPHKYLDCVKNRSHLNKIFCNACVPADFDGKFVRILYSNLMSIAPDLDTDIEDPVAHANKGRKFLRGREDVFEFGAVARTLQSILEEAQAPQVIDLLSLDVEGAEYDVLRGLDFLKFKFEYILVESRNVERLSALLQQNGYVFLEKLSEHDYLFSLAK